MSSLRRRPLEVMPESAPQPVAPAVLNAYIHRLAPASMHVHFPWQDLRDIHGPMLPGRLYIVSARTGSGKTLFVRSLLEHLVGGEQPVPTAYWSTETTSEEVIRAFAATRLGAHPARIEEDDFSQVPGGYGKFAVECANLVSDWCTDTRAAHRRLALFDEPYPRVTSIRLALEELVERGIRAFVVDHLLRCVSDLENPFSAVSTAIRALRQTASDLGLVCIVTSQQGRNASGGDRLAWFAPPDLSALKGAGTIEEEADGVLFLHRVLRDDLVRAEMAELRSGRMPLKSAIAPHLMGVGIGKARVDGSRTHAEARLWVENGVVTDLPAGARAEWQSRQHAIKTNRDLA